MKRKTLIVFAKTLLLILMPLIGLLAYRAHAEEAPIDISIKDHRFSLEKIKVKANQTFKIRIRNDDATSEEFESKSMIVEKFVGPHRTLTLTLGPLKPGTYDYFGDLHQNTARGTLTAE